MPDIAGALRSIIQSVFHSLNAHDQLAAISPTGNPMGTQAAAKARQLLNDALALLDAPEPADEVPVAPEAPPAPEIPPVVAESNPMPPPAEEANPPVSADAGGAPAASDPADTSADALNAEEAAANPTTGETPPAPPVS